MTLRTGKGGRYRYYTCSIKARQGASGSPFDTVQKAAAQIEQATSQTNSPAARGGAIRVVVEPPRFNITDYLWTGTLGLATLVGQMTVVVFLAYFLMVSGNTFRRKLLKLAGPSLSKKKVTLQALDEITGQIQRYLQVQLATSALVGGTVDSHNRPMAEANKYTLRWLSGHHKNKAIVFHFGKILNNSKKRLLRLMYFDIGTFC